MIIILFILFTQLATVIVSLCGYDEIFQLLMRNNASVLFLGNCQSINEDNIVSINGTARIHKIFYRFGEEEREMIKITSQEKKTRIPNSVDIIRSLDFEKLKAHLHLGIFCSFIYLLID